MKRVRYLFMDRTGLPSQVDCVAIVRIARLGRCNWLWQIWTAKPVGDGSLIRPAVQRMIRQGVGVSALHAHIQASSRVRALFRAQ